MLGLEPRRWLIFLTFLSPVAPIGIALILVPNFLPHCPKTPREIYRDDAPQITVNLASFPGPFFGQSSSQ